MDDDVKTLLAILALLYGSSNGIGLLKDALDPVDVKTQALNKDLGDDRIGRNVVKDDAGRVLKSLWSGFILIYVLMVLIVPTFLFVVALRGPVPALAMIGLANSTNQTSTRPSTFYWILFALSIVATAHYLSKYFKAWWALIKYLRS